MMSRRDHLLVAIFLLATIVLAAPLMTWLIIVFLPWPDANNAIFHKLILNILGNLQDSFATLRFFIAPITVFIAASISKDANSKLGYLGLLLFFFGILSVVANFTLTDNLRDGTIANYVDDAKVWAQNATNNFKQYSESFFSTCAVLFGLQMKGDI